MGRQDAVSHEESSAWLSILKGRKINKGKLITQEGFASALRVFTAGGSAGCKHEPNWHTIYPVIARTTDSRERKAQAAQAIRDMNPTCQKLLMSPTACHGCPDSPLRGREDPETNSFQIYLGLIRTISEMLDASRFGWLKGDDVTDLEFALMRMLDKEIQSRRTI